MDKKIFFEIERYIRIYLISDLKKYFLSINNKFQNNNEKLCVFFAIVFKLLPMFSDFINLDDRIGKSHQNLSDCIQFLLKKKIIIIKKGLFLVEK